VVVDGGGADTFADRLADALGTVGRRWTRPANPAGIVPDDVEDLVVVGAGPAWRALPADLVVWLRTLEDGEREDGADVVVDLRDPDWPVIRRLAAEAGPDWYVTESRAFFGARAATWDDKFGDDLPAYSAAVAKAALAPGSIVLDAGCGTGRALPALRAAVGSSGTVIGLDLTDEMLRVARERGRASVAALVVGDVRRLPLADGSVDGIFAAGLVMHLPDVAAGLAELARITRPGGSLVLFHPTGRAALAARHGRTLRPDEPLADEPLNALLASTGWRRTVYDDAVDHFYAQARRTDQSGRRPR
jgi:SAM-dependent methyltransferase